MGIIALKSRNDFLARQRRDYREHKKLTDEQLEQKMLALPVKPPIYYKLTHLQKVCFIIGAETQRFCYFNSTGTGKSLLAIALMRYFRRLGIIKHVLVLIPNKINKFEWYYELQKHSPKSSSLILKGSSTDKWKALEESDALFVFETYAGMTRMVCDAKVNKKGVNKLTPNEKKVALLAKHFQGLVCDESVRVGHHTSLPFRFCKKLSKTASAVFTMTGTPFNRDPSLLWAQMFLTDSGYTLGETLGLFRAVFCNETENYFSGMPEYKFNKKQQHLLNDFIANRSIAYPADEGSLPKCVSIQKIIELPADADVYYQQMREQLIAARGNYNESKNAFIRMRQISSGFIGYEDDETGQKAKFEFPDNPKLDYLLSLIQSIDPEHKIIVFVDFNYSGERILKLLKENKIQAGLLYGKTKDVEQVRDAFVKDKKQQVLILQNRMGVGLNLQCSRFGIYFESPVSAIDRVQCDGRFIRQHSLYKTVFSYDLLMKNTVDEQVLRYHREGGDLFERIIVGSK
jgi:superfamily II DNA or RNA helicase